MALRQGATSVEELRGLSHAQQGRMFTDLPQEFLEWLISVGHVREGDDGDVFVEPNSPADEMSIILSGSIRLRFAMRGYPLTIIPFTAGAVTGLLPYSRMTTIAARIYAVGHTRVLYIHRRDFPEMIKRGPELVQRLVSLMSDRARSEEKYEQEREKMTALGKLAAGLAHELNNPAAAIVRSTDTLRKRLQSLSMIAGKLASAGLTDEHIRAGEALRTLAHEREKTVSMTPLERGKCEEEVGDWLEDYGVPQAWVLAETFVDLGLCQGDLEKWASDAPEGSLGNVLEWVEATLASDRLIAEIGEAGSRISDLVASVKAYSHMDRGSGKQPTDLRIGLDNTLRILGHELKAKKITVERIIPDDLPAVFGYAGELNQVWTNLLDNAIDAAPEGGRIRIEAVKDDGAVEVRIIDNGGGIPAEIRDRIFEPFYTTKPVGEGTGLGLDIVQRIITQQHSGQITVDSKPGETIFTVVLPVTPPSEA
jgi:signal transduction histidine kinase